MTKTSKDVCLIIDAYSTGRHIAPMLVGYGYKCIHLQSSESLPENMTKSLRKEDFLMNIIHTGDISDVLEKIKAYKVKMCVPGYESGVELADVLCEKMKINGNSVALSSTRRNKWSMIDTVSSAGLLTASHFISNELKRIYEWIEKNQIAFPLVLKPILSANGDNVHFCESKETIKKAFEKIMQSQNCFAQRNEEVLVETYLDGEEYIVNTVSSEKANYTVEIWRVKRKMLSTIYDSCELVSPSENEYQELSIFTGNVLEALGIFYGAATTELKYTKNGIALIETGARLMGGMELSFSTEIFGYNQLTLMLESYFNPDLFKERVLAKKHISQKKYGLAVLLISDVSGYVLKEPEIEGIYDIEKLGSFYSIDFPAKGDKLEVTTDSLTGPGVVYLISDNKDELLRDYQKIREIEKFLYKNIVSEKFFGIGGTEKFFYQSPISVETSTEKITSDKLINDSHAQTLYI